jgi:hypothetical protein
MLTATLSDFNINGGYGRLITLTTVNNVLNLLGVHELTGHIENQ